MQLRQKYHPLILFVLLLAWCVPGAGQVPSKHVKTDTLTAAHWQGGIAAKFDALSDSVLAALLASNPALIDSLATHRKNIDTSLARIDRVRDSVDRALDSIAAHRNQINGILTTNAQQTDSLSELRTAVNLALLTGGSSAAVSDSLRKAHDSLAALRTQINGLLVTTAAQTDSIKELREDVNQALASSGTSAPISDSLRKAHDSLAVLRTQLNGALVVNANQNDSLAILRTQLNVALAGIVNIAPVSDSLRKAHDSLKTHRTVIDGTIASLQYHTDSIAAHRALLNSHVSTLLAHSDSLKRSLDSIATHRTNITYLMATINTVRDSTRRALDSIAVHRSDITELKNRDIAHSDSIRQAMEIASNTSYEVCNLTESKIDWSACPQFADTVIEYTVYEFSNATIGRFIALTLVNSTARDNPVAWPSTVTWAASRAVTVANADSVYVIQFRSYATDYIVGYLLSVSSVTAPIDTMGPDLIPPPPATDLAVVTTGDRTITISVSSMADDLDSILVAIDTNYIADYDAPAASGTTQERTASVMSGTATFTNGSVFYIKTPSPYDSNLVRIRVEPDFEPTSVTFGTQSYTVEPANDDSIKVWFGTSIPSGKTLTGIWSVVQDSAFSTKWIRGTLASGASSASIYNGGAIDTTKTWLNAGGQFAGVRYPSSSVGLFSGLYWRFKSGRADSIQWVSPGTLGTSSYGVVQQHTYDSCIVRGKGLVQLSSSATTGTLAVTSGDTSKQIIEITGSCSSTSSRAGRRASTVEPTNATTYTVTRDNVLATNHYAYPFVVEFTDGTNSTWQRTALAIGATSGTFSPPGDLTYSTASTYMRSADNSDTLANVGGRTSLAATSTISRQKASAAANAVTNIVNWGSIKSVGSSSGPDTVAWANATKKLPFSTSADSGQLVSITIGDLSASTAYYLSIKGQDTADNVGLQSNTVKGTTTSVTLSPSLLDRVWAVDDLTKVMDEDLTHEMTTSALNTTWANNQVVLDGFKGETVAFQLILQNGNTAIDSIAVLMDSLYLSNHSAHIKNDSTSPMAFAGRYIDVYVVQSQRITARQNPDDPAGDNWSIEYNQLDNYPPQYFPARARDTSSFVGSIPKICIPVEVDSFNRTIAGTQQLGGNPFTIPANRNQTIWVDIFIPRTQTAGDYYGTIKIYELGSLTREIGVNLKVYNVSMDYALGGEIANSNYFQGKIIAHNGSGGVAMYSAEWWRQYRKFIQLAWRHGYALQNWNGVQNLSSVYQKLSPRADQYTLDKNGAFGQYAGTLFTTGRGYDGPFYSTAQKLIVVGEYTGNVGLTPLSEARVDTTAYAWGDILTDSSSTSAWLFFSPTDEPDLKDPADVTMVTNFGTWLNNNTSGFKQYARQGSFGAAMSSTWYDYITYWLMPDAPSSGFAPGVTATSSSSNNYLWSVARSRRNAGQKTGVYNFHVGANTTGWSLDSHPSNLAAFLVGAVKDTVQLYGLWTSAYFEEKWYVYSTPRSWDYWTSPRQDKNWDRVSHFWPGNDTAYTSTYDRDFDGFFVSTQLKAWRRGQEDRVLMAMAADNGVTFSDLMYDSLNIGRWLDKWHTEVDGKPNWTYRTWTPTTSVHYIPNAPPAHNQHGYQWKKMRRLLRERIDAAVNP